MIQKLKKIYSDLNRKKLFSEFAVDFKHFTLKLAFNRMCYNFPVLRAKFPNIHQYFNKKVQCAIKEVLFERYKYVFKEFKKKHVIIEKETICNEKEVWVFWWQGEENAPLLVKNCICSIRKNSGADNVYILSKDNYQSFAQIPDYVIEKFAKGQIGTAHFSDILRMALLCQRGGIWLDATVFCSREIPNEIFNYSFFTCRNTKKISYDSNMFSWTPFIFGSTKGSPVTGLILDFLLAYWEKEVLAIDYLFLDIILELIYENAPSIKEQMDSLTCNNEQVLIMLKEMKTNLSFSKERLDTILYSDTFVFKLSWKPIFKEVSKDGQKTLYYHYLHHYNDFLIDKNALASNI